MEQKLTLKPDAGIAAKLASKVQLVGVHFARVSGTVLELYAGEGDLGWRLDTIEAVWDGEETALRVLLPYTLTVTSTKADEAPKNHLEVKVLMRLDYQMPKDEQFSEEEKAHYAGVLGVMHSWPYFRAEVQALTAKVELPALTLPAIVSGHVENLATVRRVTDPKADPSGSGSPKPILPTVTGAPQQT